MVAVPALTAVTTPSAETLTIPVFELDHTTGVPVTMAPEASRVVAASCVVCPTVIETASGVITTVATAPGVTVIVAASLLPSLVPVMVAVPTATAVTMPLASIVATPVLLLVQMIARSVSGFCAAS
jgi:hypothetical protein